MDITGEIYMNAKSLVRNTGAYDHFEIQIDCEQIARNHIKTMTLVECMKYVNNYYWFEQGRRADKQLLNYLIYYNDWQDFCYNINFIEDKEIFEYWVVSEWLYQQLKKHSEPVAMIYDIPVWGRTESNLALKNSSVIQEIQKSIETKEIA